MNKIFICLFIFYNIPTFLFAQYDNQFSIGTDDGVFTVSKTNDGKDMILFPVDIWDNMVKGTRYISRNIDVIEKERICIQLSNKKYRQCRGGIGFRCGIFNCFRPGRLAVAVNNENRICSVMIRKPDAFTVKVVFLDNVDWYDLQSDQ